MDRKRHTYINVYNFRFKVRLLFFSFPREYNPSPKIMSQNDIVWFELNCP